MCDVLCHVTPLTALSTPPNTQSSLLADLVEALGELAGERQEVVVDEAAGTGLVSAAVTDTAEADTAVTDTAEADTAEADTAEADTAEATGGVDVNAVLAELAAMTADRNRLVAVVAEQADVIAQLRAAEGDHFDRMSATQRKAHVKDNGWFLNQNKLTPENMRAYQRRVDHMNTIDNLETVVAATKAQLSSVHTTNMKLIVALSAYNVPNLQTMAKPKLLDALVFFTLTD